MKALGVVQRVERYRVRARTGHAEVVADAAEAEHQRVVGQRSPRQDLLALRARHRVEHHLAARTIEADDRTLAEAEVMPMRDREIVELVRVGVHAAGRDLVQQRLPHVRRVPVDERDLRHAAAAIAVAEARRERQAAGAAADDDDAMRECSVPA